MARTATKAGRCDRISTASAENGRKLHETQHAAHPHHPRGSLPRPDALIEVTAPRWRGAVDDKTFAARLAQSVDEICRTRRGSASTSLNDGEFGKATRAAIDYGAWQELHLRGCRLGAGPGAGLAGA